MHNTHHLTYLCQPWFCNYSLICWLDFIRCALFPRLLWGFLSQEILFQQFNCTKYVLNTHQMTIWLSGKRCANGGSDFWLSIKSVSNTLSCCCFVHNCSVSQWKQYELQIWSHWRNIIFWKWKAPRNSTPENGQTHGECFWCFHWRTWRIKTLPQSMTCTEEISLYTVHIKSIITKFCFWS